MDSSSKS